MLLVRLPLHNCSKTESLTFVFRNGESSFYLFIGAYGWEGIDATFQIVATTTATFLARPITDLGPQSFANTLSSTSPLWALFQLFLLFFLLESHHFFRRCRWAHLWRGRKSIRAVSLLVFAMGWMQTLREESIPCTPSPPPSLFLSTSLVSKSNIASFCDICRVNMFWL